MTHTLVLLPYLKDRPQARSIEAQLAEAVALAEAINLNVRHAEAVGLREIKANAYLGAGTVERMGAIIREMEIELVILSCALSPVQQRNLEKLWQAKVIDRTALILEIFGSRAKTKEGSLQVDLAHLSYARSRLVRSWTHLERQRGGAGFLGGPGETQIELDRRALDDEIIKIKKELASVKKTRALHRQARSRVPYPVIALVGYTNAGKSTLFNALTHAAVLEKDMLFATLDTTMRQLRLPHGARAILSDTVGFISDLPTELVMAFRATLEEVAEADLIVHVRDFSHPDTQVQKEDVERVLRELGLGEQVDKGLTEALNKVDLMDADEQRRVFNQRARRANEWPLSAKTGVGIPAFLEHVESRLTQGCLRCRLQIPIERGDILASVYRNGSVLSRRDTETQIQLTALLPPQAVEPYRPYMPASRGGKKASPKVKVKKEE